MPEISAQSLTEAYYNNNFEVVETFIREAPVTIATQTSLLMAGGHDPFFVMCAINGMAAAYTHGNNHRYAGIFANAAYDCLCFYCTRHPDGKKDQVPYYAGSSAYLLTKLYLDTGEYAQALALYERVKKDFSEDLASQELISLHLNIVETYLELKDPATARLVFQRIVANDIPYAAKVNYQRLQAKLAMLFPGVSLLPEEESTIEQINKKAGLAGMDAAIGTMLDQLAGDNTEAAQQAKAMMERIRTSFALMENDDAAAFTAAMEDYNALQGYLQTIAGAPAAPGIGELRQQLQQYQSILHDEIKGWDPLVLDETLQQLKGFLSNVEHKYNDLTKFCLWSIHLCENRLEKYGEAAASLERLRAILAGERMLITDSKERAGVFRSFKFLFPNLVEMHYRNGNARAVLKAVEASKGRLLTDAIAAQTRDEPAAEDYDLPVEQLPALLQANNAHYLSFFLAEQFTIMCLVTRNGKFYAGHVAGGKSLLQPWVEDHQDDPKEWKGAGLKGLFSKKINIQALLEDYCKLLKIAMDDGHITAGDHIVYSPDDLLFLFPLHYVLFNSKPLIEHFSLSRIHGAYQLAKLLQQPALVPASVVCCTVPAENDMADSEKTERFSAVAAWLAHEYASTGVQHADDVPALMSTDHPNALLHFATHGVFPVPGMHADKINPYRNSGLLLKDNGKLPVLHSELIYRDQPNFLNPQKLFESGRSWQYSHVTFQACVSARSKESVGGDALGMESAAFFCGAGSILSAGWNIPITWANQFCLLFYQYWLTEKLPKAAAFRNAMLTILKNEIPSDQAPAYYWAGMILSGDWR